MYTDEEVAALLGGTSGFVVLSEANWCELYYNQGKPDAYFDKTVRLGGVGDQFIVIDNCRVYWKLPPMQPSQPPLPPLRT
jgi:hypothetical protein